ncbi:hypothetical protein EV195_102260 [Tenacibaculum skagerrakense]|uniref:Lipoprotein n=1 Tax=Tenacibaculum skagerrakense TaxID=186571 RepID=A0A4R2NYV4_9FLAO|nr:hypothetical protein [Tenacibaculum skagerrakense]TCP26918.1 hypothetical protein EV195_102260 [Tenacibaculum skagerrakense]
MNRILQILGILIFLISCKSSEIGQQSEFKIENDSINLYAFIGEKIAVIEFDPNENNTRIKIDSITGDTIRRMSYMMDNGFRNKYKVVRNIFNDLKTDTIEFVAYDHYGRPGFENYENVILYISLNKEKGYFYHQKYQYDVVEKTKKGTWKGLHGESIENLFNKKKKGVLTARGLFD